MQKEERDDPGSQLGDGEVISLTRLSYPAAASRFVGPAICVSVTTAFSATCVSGGSLSRLFAKNHSDGRLCCRGARRPRNNAYAEDPHIQALPR